MSDAATKGSEYQIRRSDSIFQTSRQPSAKLGGSSSVSTTTSEAPIARRSCAPRTGGESRQARTTKNIAGTVNTKKGTRQPKLCARSPTARGPTQAPTAVADRFTEKHLGMLRRRYDVGATTWWVGCNT